MTRPQLIEYLKLIRDTEASIYTTQRVINGLHSLYDTMVMPSAPVEPKMIEKRSAGGAKAGVTVMVFAAIIAIIIISSRNKIVINGILWTQVVSGIIGLVAMIVSLVNTHIANTGIEDKNQQAEYNYNRQYNKYQKDYATYQEQYKAKKELADSKKAELQSYLNELKQRLADLYGLNILYPKYHDWVAVCSFLEYFESGRCEQLDGPDGAYNVYEAEVRQNLIISELEKIGNDVNSLQKHQYQLYACITAANNDVTRILNNIHNQFLLSEYENKVNAQMIAASNYLAHM